MRVLLIPACALLLTGCIARTAVDIVTLPVRAVSAGVDALTTSDSERDQRRGRELREEDERRGREARQAERRNRDGAARDDRDGEDRDGEGRGGEDRDGRDPD